MPPRSCLMPVLTVAGRITYRKKKDKMATIKAQKDETVRRDDVYKSSTIHVPSGEPGSSQSAPLPKKIAIVRPITKGKLLRPGGPSKPVRVSSAMGQVLQGLTSACRCVRSEGDAGTATDSGFSTSPCCRSRACTTSRTSRTSGACQYPTV